MPDMTMGAVSKPPTRSSGYTLRGGSRWTDDQIVITGFSGYGADGGFWTFSLGDYVVISVTKDLIIS